MLEICWWYYLQSEICSKNTKKTLDLLKTWNRWVMMTSQPWTLPSMKWLRVTSNRTKCPKGPLGIILWHSLHFYTSTVLRFVCSVIFLAWISYDSKQSDEFQAMMFCEAAVLKLLKNAIYICSSHFVLLNKRHKLWPRKRNSRVWPKLWTERHSVSVDLRFERRITVYKHFEGFPDTCLSFTNLLLDLLFLTTWNSS